LAAVKICGVMSIEDAIAVEAAGARYVGMILEGSRRAVGIDMIIDASRTLSKSRVVAVITGRDVLDKYIERLDPIETLQLHYSYSPKDIEILSTMGYRVIPVIIIKNNTNPDMESTTKHLTIFSNAIEYVLFDAPKDTAPAEASGLKLPISVYTAACRSYRPCGVAGGITPNNISNLKPVRPDVIDVSSGVETSFGKKDPMLVRKLIEAAGVI